MAPDFTAQPEFNLKFAATMPLLALPRFTSEELLAAVNYILLGTGATAKMEPELTTSSANSGDGLFWHRTKSPPRVGLTVNGATFQIEGFDRPAYASSDLAKLDFGAWPDGRKCISRSRSHVQISEIWATGGSDFDHNCDRAAALSVVAEAVAQLTETIGAVWQTSDRAVSIDQLRPLFSSLKNGEAPMQLWLGCSGRQQGAGGAETHGFYPFIGAEIEVASTELSPDTAIEVALEVVGEIFRTGNPPAKGARLDLDKQHSFNVDYRAGKRKPRKTADLPKVVLTRVILPVESGISAGAA